MAVKGLFVNATEVRDLVAGEAVFARGDDGRQMFGVLSGQIELRLDGVALSSIGPEGTFGELAIIDHAPRSLDAIAIVPSRVAVIDEAAFLFLVHETPFFALQVMRSLTARIRELDAARS